MFQVRLFGYFTITKGNQILNEASLRSPQLLKLLVYLILYRDRGVTNQELEQYLWDLEGSSRQKDALKNLICRLRRVLSETFGNGNYIVTGRGNYQWNNEYELQIDADQFETAYNKYMTLVSEQNKINTINIEETQKIRAHAIEMYKGIFLKSYETEYWANLGLKYQSMYLQLAKDELDLFKQNNNYPEIEKLCTRVLNTDPYDEEWNKNLVKALLAQNKQSHAEKYYRGLEKSMQGIRGIQKTNLLRILKSELKHTEISSNLITYESLEKDIKAYGKQNSIFVVSYRELKALLSLQVMKDKRHNKSSYIIFISVYLDTNSLDSAAEVRDFLINMGMDELEKVLRGELRSCDVVCKCSDTQYIVLLDDCSYDGALKAARRISERYSSEKSSKITKIGLDVHKISNFVI